MLSVLDSKADVLHPIETIPEVRWGRHQEKSIFAQNWPEYAKFHPKSVFSGPRVVSSRTPYPIMRMLASKADVLHAIEAIEQAYPGRQHQKNHFLP